MAAGIAGEADDELACGTAGGFDPEVPEPEPEPEPLEPDPVDPVLVGVGRSCCRSWLICVTWLSSLN